MLRGLCLFLLAVASAGVNADSDAPFLWQVQGAHATHYLLGSVHLLPDSGNDLPAGLDEAYDAVDSLVFETNVGALKQSSVQMALMAAAKSEHGLKAEVGDPLYQSVTRKAQGLGLPASACDDVKAWFCAMWLEVFALQKAGFSDDNAADTMLYRWAREDAKTIAWFESPSVQLGLFSGMSPQLAREFLASEVDSSGVPGDDDPAALLRAWREDDFPAIEALVRQFKTRYPAIYDRLLAARNRAWLPMLKQILDGATPTLVVVGAGHYAGPDGLLAQLKTRGYKVLPYTSSHQQLLTGVPPALVQTALKR